MTAVPVFPTGIRGKNQGGLPADQLHFTEIPPPLPIPAAGSARDRSCSPSAPSSPPKRTSGAGPASAPGLSSGNIQTAAAENRPYKRRQNSPRSEAVSWPFRQGRILFGVSSSFKIFFRSFSNCLPALVRTTPRAFRSNRGTPTSRSSRAICLLKSGLRNIKLLRRPGHALRLRHLQKITDLFQSHYSIPPLFSEQCTLFSRNAQQSRGNFPGIAADTRNHICPAVSCSSQSVCVFVRTVREQRL